MADLNKIPQSTLNLVLEDVVKNRFRSLGAGTGNTPGSLSTTEIDGQVDLESATNKNINANSEVINNNTATKTFKITGSSPVSQPVDLAQVGLHESKLSSTDVRLIHTFRVPITKDTSTQLTIKTSVGVIESESNGV